MAIRPIYDEFLEPNQYAILMWHDGITLHRVEAAEPVHFAPWKLINSSGTTVDIAADSSQAELSFLDPRNNANDILYLNSQTDPNVNDSWAWLLHGAIGIRPIGRHLRCYIRFEKSGYYYGNFPELGPIQATSSGNYLGDINGLLSPYWCPTNYREIWVPPRTYITSEWYNDDPERSINPVCNLAFQLYYMSNINPNSDVEYERELAKMLAQGKIKSKVAQMGPVRHMKNFPFNDWKYEDGGIVKPFKRSAIAGGQL